MKNKKTREEKVHVFNEIGYGYSCQSSCRLCPFPGGKCIAGTDRAKGNCKEKDVL